MPTSPPPPRSFDHVALWVSDRDELADFLCSYLGLHVIERSDSFTLVGADALEGKVTLFDAEAPRDPGPLRRIVFRTSDLDTAIGRLPNDLPVERSGGLAQFEGPQGVGFGLLEDDGIDYDLDHVVLEVADPDATARALTGLGFQPAEGGVAIGERSLRLEAGSPDGAGQPLLNHLALLVSSAEEWRRAAEAEGIEVTDTKDAPNTYAVFLRGPEDISLEYVEHKPGFSLV